MPRRDVRIGAQSEVRTTTDGYTVSYSTRSDRSSPTGLDGAAVRDEIYVFATPTVGVDRVTFFIDGHEGRTELVAPFDLVGEVFTPSGWLLLPLDTATLRNGQHTIAARFILDSGLEVWGRAQFQVSNGVAGASVAPATVAATASLGVVGIGSQSSTIVLPGSVAAIAAVRIAVPTTGSSSTRRDATNTGYGPAGYTLTSTSGSTTITTPQTITGRSYSGSVKVDGVAVTFRGCRFNANGTSSYAIQTLNGGSCVVEDSDILGAKSIGVYGQKTTVRRCNMYQNGDYFRPSRNNVLEDSYLHDFRRWTSTGHFDLIQITNNSGGTIENITVRGNTLIGWTDSGDHVSGVWQSGSFSQDCTPPTSCPTYIRNILFENNYIDGGTYALRGTGASRETEVIFELTNWVWRNNRFGRFYRSGPYLAISSRENWENSTNLYDDNGAQVRS